MQRSVHRHIVFAAVALAAGLTSCHAPRTPDPGAGAAVPEGGFGFLDAFAPEFVPFWTSLGLDYSRYQAWAGAQLKGLGATWTRSNTQLIWDKVEPVIGGGYDWSASFDGDGVFAAAGHFGIRYLAVLHDGCAPVAGLPPLRNPLDDLDSYERFVRAAVERYSRAGEANGGLAIHDWQVGAETGIWSFVGRSAADYVRWFEATAATIRQADPAARVVLIAGMDGTKVDSLHAEVIPTLVLDGVRFDAVDIHHWGTADLTSSTMSGVSAYRELFSSLGLDDVKIVAGEHGTYVGTPAEGAGKCAIPCAAADVCTDLNMCRPRCRSDVVCPAEKPRCDIERGLCIYGYPAQTALDQARSLVYRYTVNRALGVSRIFWNNLASWRCFGGACGGYYDRLGLVADGQGPGETVADIGTPRLAFYSYRLLAANSDDTIADQLGEIANADPSVHVFGYRNRASGRRGLVAWAEDARAATVAFDGEQAVVTSLITDASGEPLRTESLPATGGELAVALDPNPVWIAPP